MYIKVTLKQEHVDNAIELRKIQEIDYKKYDISKSCPMALVLQETLNHTIYFGYSNFSYKNFQYECLQNVKKLVVKPFDDKEYDQIVLGDYEFEPV